MSDPGTGKTFVEIMDYAARRSAKEPPALVLAPKTLLQSAWGNDIEKFAPHLRYSIARAENRANAFAAEADIYLTNHDAVAALAKQPPSFWKKFRGGTLIVDESTAYKHATSQRSKAVAKIAQHFKTRRLLSGTPNPNGVCDLWHQVKILDDGQRLGKSFFHFRASVCSPEQVGPLPQHVKWTDKAGAEEAVAALLADITLRHKLEDCVDIPDNHHYDVPFHISGKHLAAYKELERDSILLLKNNSVTAVNGAALYNKLLQVASGAVYGDDEGYTLLDSTRYELVMDLVEARPHSVVFFLWKHQRDELVKQAQKRGLSYALIDGSVTRKGARERAVEEFQGGEHRVMFAHPRSAGHGLTLTRGTATIWASPTPDLEFYQQGWKRIHRIGQSEKTETIVVVAPGTRETDVFASLQHKKLKMSTLLTLLKESH
jgi:SNF2 family DNA or RNA helicase